MLPERARRVADEIAHDRTQGAFPLALRALDAYASLPKSPDPRVLDELHASLVAAQPWMVAVHNASHLSRRLVVGGGDGAMNRLRTRLLASRRRVADRAAEVLKDARTIVTLSYSSDVLQALTHPRAPKARVYVAESRPLREGVQLAADLRQAGVEAILVADAAAAGLVPRSDAVLTGADAILRRGGLVNKVGTLPLALACQRYGVPFLPLLEAFKVELEGQEMSWETERRDPHELSTEVEALNIYFEEVDRGLLEVLVTDIATASVEEILNRVRTAEDLESLYLEGAGPSS